MEPKITQEFPEHDPKKTGYEESGQTDPRGQIESDDEIKLPSKKKEPEKNVVPAKEQKSEQKTEGANNDSDGLTDYERSLLEGDEDLTFAKKQETTGK